MRVPIERCSNEHEYVRMIHRIYQMYVNVLWLCFVLFCFVHSVIWLTVLDENDLSRCMQTPRYTSKVQICFVRRNIILSDGFIISLSANL